MSIFEEDYEKNLRKWKAKREHKKDSITKPLPKTPPEYTPLPTIKEKSLDKKVKILILIVPIIIFLYIVYNNFIASHEFTYLYDIGDDSYLTPQQRVSETIIQDTSYRELKEGLVYFTVPIARGSEKAIVKVRFKDNFPENTIFNLGAKDQESWHYKWNVIYNPSLSNLDKYKIGPKIYKINQEIGNFSLQELEETTGQIIGTNTDMKNIPVQGEDYIGETTINTALRGGHVFYIYSGGDLNLEVKKQDLNWYNNSDELEVSVLDTNNNLIANMTIQDDGKIEIDKETSVIQSGSLQVNIPEGVYRVEFSDFDGLIKEIKVIILDNFI